ncbi:MAG: L-aspartate oxidase, partial [Polyangiales bacterium]
MSYQADVLVLGTCVAGLSFALEAAKSANVCVVSKGQRGDTATAWAQGGIAAALDPEDSFAAHVADTKRVGCGLSDPAVALAVVCEGPARVAQLVEMGARFCTAAGAGFDLTREGGHSTRRIVHANDRTGLEVQRTLLAAVEAHPHIVLHEAHMAIDLIEMSKFGGPTRVVGAYLLDTRTGQVHTALAGGTVLATGGAGKVYLYTSNPDLATGDGVAMAYRAGAEVANMEFFQFHPTCLYHPRLKNFLISETLRGEGGVLRRADGHAFMQEHHPRADLAARDVVAQAIDYEMKKSGATCVYLDMSACAPAYLRRRFPHITTTCASVGIDITTEPIPVVPAAHYMCGGVAVDAAGATTLPGLWAVGEVACTGLHGANRLASNSLLEGLVCAHAAAQHWQQQARMALAADVPAWDIGEAAPSDEAVVVTQNWDELRRTMWNYVGIVRSDKRLRRAARRIALLKDEIREYYWQHLVTPDLLELRNIADVAELIVACAAFRRESRGLHANLDHPARDDTHFGADTR